jgi:hypothetical protein
VDKQHCSRLGFRGLPSQRTVIHGGYGIFTDARLNHHIDWHHWKWFAHQLFVLKRRTRSAPLIPYPARLSAPLTVAASPTSIFVPDPNF